jgi:predicted transposase YbfD/YdcC
MGESHLGFLRRFLPYHHGVPGARWLTILMNRIDPGLFSAAFMAWVRETWPDRLDLVAIDGKTSRRSHDHGADKAPLHLVSAFATTSRLVLGQEAVADKTNEITAIPLLIERLATKDGLKGALVSIDAIATNPTIAATIRDAQADYLLAVKANQPTLRSEIETFFADAPQASVEGTVEVDKGHGRVEQRTVTVAREVDWLEGNRRFPGEVRLPDVATIVRVASRAELKDRCRLETRYYVSSAALSAARAAQAVRSHWAIENSLHWVSTLSSATTNHGCEKVMAQKTWPSSDTSQSISCAAPTTNEASSSGANVLAGINEYLATMRSDTYRVNPDSEPCAGGPAVLIMAEPLLAGSLAAD